MIPRLSIENGIINNLIKINLFIREEKQDYQAITGISSVILCVI